MFRVACILVVVMRWCANENIQHKQKRKKRKRRQTSIRPRPDSGGRDVKRHVRRNIVVIFVCVCFGCKIAACLRLGFCISCCFLVLRVVIAFNFVVDVGVLVEDVFVVFPLFWGLSFSVDFHAVTYILFLFC